MLPFGAFWLCLTGSSANASCGDYLHTRFGPPAMSAQHEQTSVGQREHQSASGFESSDQASRLQPTVELVTVFTQNQLPSGPCSGPDCRSNQNRSPVPSAPLPVELTIQVKAVASFKSLETSSVCQSSLQAMECRKRSAGHRCRIERPPQAPGLTVGVTESVA